METITQIFASIGVLALSSLLIYAALRISKFVQDVFYLQQKVHCIREILENTRDRLRGLEAKVSFIPKAKK